MKSIECMKMSPMRGLLILFFLIAMCGESIAQKVEEHDGNIFFIAPDGSRRQLTSTGLDSQPSLSFGGRWVVFVHRTPDLKIRVPIGEVDDGCCTLENEIWIADITGLRPPHRILRAPANGVMGHRVMAGFSMPVFSADGNRIFFRTIAAADSLGFHSLNLSSGFIRFLFHGVDYSMIRTGRYRGYMTASVFVPNSAQTHIASYWLVNPEGRLLNPIRGGTQYELSQFKEQNGIP
jgi:hypothetical protein